MKQSSKGLITGVSASIIGVVSVVVVFLQPWRSCEEDDSPAGCPVTELDANLMVVAMLVLAAGLAIVLFTLIRTVGRPTP